MISIKQLNYALAVEKTLHFKNAAELCHVSQSALSTAITEMENQLGFQVFERDNKKVLVTPLGKEVLVRAQSVLLQVEELHGLADSLKQPLSFPVTIGAIPTIAPYLLPRIFPRIRAEHPDAKINIIEEQSHVLIDMVRRGEIDTAILALPYVCDGLLAMEFWQEDFYWVHLKEKHSSKLNEVDIDDIDQNQIMLLKEGHCLKDHILDACKLNVQTANSGFGATSLNTLIQMVINELGTTLVPEMAIDQLVTPNKQLTAVHLNTPGPHRRIAFIVRPNYTRMSSIEALIKICSAALSNSSN